jgi:voltage-gated potassium channel
MTTTALADTKELRPLPAAGWRGPVMFGVAFANLLAVAGLLHRADHAAVFTTELWLMLVVFLGTWPVIVAEAATGFWFRDRSRRRWPAAVRVLVVAAFPPARMGFVDPRTGLVWLPRLGWQEPGRRLSDRLEKAFHGPMLVFAMLILPALAVEFMWADAVRQSPAFALVLHGCVAAIWVAFAVELIVRMSAAAAPLTYLKERWIDAAIVVLPTLEFALHAWAEAGPVARLLRAARSFGPDQLARMGRLYRLRGLLTKGWQALLAIEVLARLIGQTPKRRLKAVEEKIEAMEEQLADLRRQAEELRDRLATPATAPTPAAAPPRRHG